MRLTDPLTRLPLRTMRGDCHGHDVGVQEVLVGSALALGEAPDGRRAFELRVRRLGALRSQSADL
jgi:hypothetical protein